MNSPEDVAKLVNDCREDTALLADLAENEDTISSVQADEARERIMWAVEELGAMARREIVTVDHAKQALAQAHRINELEEFVKEIADCKPLENVSITARRLTDGQHGHG